MNLFIVKSGVVVLVAAVCAFFAWRSQRAHETCRESRSEFDGQFIEQCCVCLTDFRSNSFSRADTATLPCKHKFHRTCIKGVLEHEERCFKKCPICRSVIPPSFVETILSG